MSTLSEMISYGHIENKLMHPHRNPGMEIVLVEKGQLEWAVQNVPEVLNPGIVFFTLPWQVHGSLKVREPRNRIYFTLIKLGDLYEEPSDSIRMPPSLGFSRQEESLISSVLVSARQHAWPATALLRSIFPELICKLDGTTELDRAGARALLKSAIVELVNIVNGVPQRQSYVSPSFRRVETFLKELVQALDQPWALDEMAEACGVKRTQFAKITKQLTGYPPSQYLSRIRFERACELLRTSERAITEIALECGYGSSQYFSETFRKISQMTPTEYRRNLPDLDAKMKESWRHPEHRSVSDEQKRLLLFR